jgi:antitoxin component YwqK of YwqJK toxin-antitoxin module
LQRCGYICILKEFRNPAFADPRMMKPPTKTLISLAMLALLSCTKESTTDSSMLVLKANRYYLQDESQPYSGQATAFHENGQQQAKLDFVNGSYAGLVKYWDESGEVKLEANIRDGLLHGKFYYQEEDYLYDALYEQGELLSREIRYQQDETRVIQR